jgi:hypothetical protein
MFFLVVVKVMIGAMNEYDSRNYIPSQEKKRLQHTDALTISIIYHFNRT